MLKLPLCPHCNTVYRFNEVKKIASHKKYTCYHCKKEFLISRKFVFLLFVIVAVIAMAVNVAQLYMTPSLNILMLLVTNIILVSVGVALVPFFIRFTKSKDKKSLNKSKNNNKFKNTKR